MKRIPLFITACFLGGVGGLVGSMIGRAIGKSYLFAGGWAGGIAIALLTAKVATSRGWVPRDRYWRVAIGAGLGFVAAASVAVNTLSSPVGPVLSVLLIGLGALVGAGPTEGS